MHEIHRENRIVSRSERPVHPQPHQTGLTQQAKDTVLRYLGRRGQAVPPQLDALVEECLGEIRSLQPRHTYRIFDLERTPLQDKPGTSQDEADPHQDEPTPETLFLRNTQVTLFGQGIGRHLKGCRRAVLLAVTLGVDADNLIRRREHTDMTRALVLDACATQQIESACDAIEQHVCREALSNGLTATSRYSPGYGDLPLDIQPRLLAALDAERKIGLTCTQNLILLPRKSVTAIIGLGENLNHGRKHQRCDLCGLKETCPYGI